MLLIYSPNRASLLLRPLAKLSPEHSRIHKASIMIEAFKNVFPDTEFYSFDESLQQGGPVNKFFNILGISDLNDLNEYRNNKGLFTPFVITSCNLEHIAS